MAGERRGCKADSGRGAPWAARVAVLLAALHGAGAPAPAAAAVRGASLVDALGHADTSGSGRVDGLATVRWISDTGGERRVDVYAFDCARARYAHVVSERHHGATRLERIALAESRWAMALQPLPPAYPVLAVHRARNFACPPPPRRP